MENKVILLPNNDIFNPRYRKPLEKNVLFDALLNIDTFASRLSYAFVAKTLSKSLFVLSYDLQRYEKQ